MHANQVVDCNDVETAPEGSTEVVFTLIDLRLERSSGLEGVSLPTGPRGKDEGSDHADTEVWCHPDLGAGTSLAVGVSAAKLVPVQVPDDRCDLGLPSRSEHDQLTDLADHSDNESHPNEEVELCVCRVGDERLPTDKNDRQSEE